MRDIFVSVKKEYVPLFEFVPVYRDGRPDFTDFCFLDEGVRVSFISNVSDCYEWS